MLKILLYPFSLLYGMAITIRNILYDWNIRKSHEFDVPVISIGNITVGGTGKTPHVEYLIQLLKDKFEVATLSRGYKRKTKGFLEVRTGSTVAEVGDEPLQIKRKFPEVTVTVCENRIVGVKNLLQEKKEKIPDVILLDDAFQHRRIVAGINILLIDYNRPLKDDLLLPAGRLREGMAQMQRANVIIFTKCPNEITPITRRILQKDVRLRPYQEMFFTAFNYEEIKPVFSAKKLKNDFYEKNTHAVLIVTGIAWPKVIPEYIRSFCSRTELIRFPDHHNYSHKDISLIMEKFQNISAREKIIVTTEKDAVRFAALSEPDEAFKNALYYLPVKVKFLDAEGKMFNKKILNYVGENKSNRELYKRKNQRSS